MSHKSDFTFTLHGQDLVLTPEKAIYWIQNNVLILSDLHLGKSGHFRKHGIPVPSTLNKENLNRLDHLIQRFNVRYIYFLGDLFHSDRNEEWKAFSDWRIKHKETEMVLTLGNHDFHSLEEYEILGLKCSDSIEAHPFRFLHDSEQTGSPQNLYTISGHIHPSVKMKGKGRQSVYLPCFYFSENHALLPAFGSFTGTYSIKPAVSDNIFVITGNQIIPIQ